MCCAASVDATPRPTIPGVLRSRSACPVHVRLRLAQERDRETTTNDERAYAFRPVHLVPNHRDEVSVDLTMENGSRPTCCVASVWNNAPTACARTPTSLRASSVPVSLFAAMADTSSVRSSSICFRACRSMRPSSASTGRDLRARPESQGARRSGVQPDALWLRQAPCLADSLARGTSTTHP